MKTIWYDKENEVNSYAECVSRFCYDDGECYADISADGEFELYINGKFAANGQYPDYPFYKVYERVDISEFCVKGENVIAVRAYHDGLKNSSVWYPKTAGVAFRVFSGEAVLTESDENTLVRKSLVYKSGDMEVITNQLGYSYKADLTKEDDWKTRIGCDGFVNAEVKDADYTFNPRPIKRCSLSSPLESKAVMQGYFVEAGGDLPSLKAQNALLSFVRFSDMTGKDKIKFADKPVGFACEKGDGIYAVYDLGRETSGYMNFDITVDEDTDMIVAYGEHLSDGRVRAEVGLRNFAFSVKLKKGKNVFSNYIRRLGLRYLQVYIYAHKATIDKLTVREYFYPVEELPKKFNDKLVEKIYETGVRTLRLCMHEHYEDCPWREQALYAMDSRNQMLFGYGAFGEYEYPRASLRTIALSTDEDGLFSLCSPAKMNITIPIFSLFWVLALYENAKVDIDKKFLAEMIPHAERIADIFAARLTENGVESFQGVRYWNFYEWSDGLDGGEIFKKVESAPSKDIIPTAILALAAEYISELEKILDRKEQAETYRKLSEKAASAVGSFYDEESGLYYSYIKDGKKTGLHSYSLAAALYSGAVGKERAKKIAEILISKDERITPCTPAALQLYYEAIITYSKNGLDFVWNDIEERFGKMIYSGATSLWETDLGEADFEEGGSLCHAWSAVPCYIYDKFGR